MKKTWEDPTIVVENFVPNEYVAACITGTIQCVYPGTQWEKGDNGVYDDYNGQQSGWYTDSEKKLHGICGNNATISFNGDTLSGFEFIGGVAQSNRPIYSISGYNQENGTGTYYVTWTSEDRTGSTPMVYHHKGRLIVTDIDENRPNHS